MVFCGAVVGQHSPAGRGWLPLVHCWHACEVHIWLQLTLCTSTRSDALRGCRQARAWRHCSAAGAQRSAAESFSGTLQCCDTTIADETSDRWAARLCKAHSPWSTAGASRLGMLPLPGRQSLRSHCSCYVSRGYESHPLLLCRGISLYVL